MSTTTLRRADGFGGFELIGLLASLVIVALLMTSQLGSGGAGGGTPAKGNSAAGSLQIAENDLATQAQERQTLTPGGGGATTLTDCVSGYFANGAGLCLALSLASGGQPTLYRTYCPADCPAPYTADGTVAQSPSAWPAAP